MKKSQGPRCIECGGVLAKQKSKTLEDDLRLPRYGIHGNGKFCTLTCAFAWAVRWAKRIYFWR